MAPGRSIPARGVLGLRTSYRKPGVPGEFWHEDWGDFINSGFIPDVYLELDGSVRMGLETGGFEVTVLRSNKINVYVCDTCKHNVVTVDRDEGVTPFMTSCTECGKPAYSCFYKVPQDLTPTIEWYKPTDQELAAMKSEPELEDLVDHVKKGGLMTREIGGSTWFEGWKKRNE